MEWKTFLPVGVPVGENSLQWGHIVMEWKTVTKISGTFRALQLQWGHFVMEWKTEPLSAAITSTGPRLQWGHSDDGVEDDP